MTLPPVVRVFFAIDLPPSAKEAVGSLINALKRKSKSHAIRWSRPENLHITLQFLPEVQSEHVNKLLDNVRTEISVIDHHPLITFEKIHLFPTPYRPRVTVLDITPQEDLALVAKVIGTGLISTNYPIETRPFRAHLTLGRIKQPQGMNLSFLTECEVPEIEKIAVEEVVLFRSEPQPEGSRYSVLGKIKLNQ